MHDLLPHGRVVLLDRVALAQDTGIVDETVKAAELGGQAVGERGVGVAAGNREVHDGDRGPRRARQGLDLVVHFLELFHVAPVQDDPGAVAGSVDGKRAPDPVARAGYENNAPVEQVVGVGVGLVIHYCRVLSGESESSSAAGSSSPLSIMVRGTGSSVSSFSSVFFSCTPSSTNLRAPGSTLRSSEPTALL